MLPARHIPPLRDEELVAWYEISYSIVDMRLTWVGDTSMLPNLPGKPIAVGAVVTDASGCVLLVQPSYKRGRWDLPGGIVDKQEDPLAALHREISEELQAVPVAPRLTGLYHTMPYDTLKVIFRTALDREPVPDGKEIVRCQHIHLQEIESLTMPWIVDRVLDAVEFAGETVIRVQTEDASGNKLPSRSRPWDQSSVGSGASQRARIREMDPIDAPRVAYLANQLGYPTSVEAATNRIRSLLADPTHLILVADDSNEQVIGWIQVGAKKSLIST